MKKSWKLSERREYHTPPTNPKPVKKIRLRKKRLSRRFGFFGGGVGGWPAEVVGGTLFGGDVCVFTTGGGGGVNGTFAGGMVLSDVDRGGEAEARPGAGGVEAVLL